MIGAPWALAFVNRGVYIEASGGNVNPDVYIFRSAGGRNDETD
jgi:hypothetical protein